MTKIAKVQRAGGPRWRFTLNLGRDPVTGNRRQRVYTYDTMSEAKRELARLTGQMAAGAFTDRSKMTVNEALDVYLRSACFEREAATKVSYAGALLPVRDRLGGRRLQSLTRADVEDLRDWLLTSGRRRGGTPGTALGPRSVALSLGRFKAALALACAEGWLARNPAEHVRPPRQAKRQDTTWSADQLRAFLTEASRDRLAACWLLSALGLRRSELLGLRWADIDQDAGTLTIARARVLVYAKVVEKPPKSARSARVLPLFEPVASALAGLQARQLEEMDAAGPAYANAGYVAADELGQPLYPEWYSDEFGRLCRAAGLPKIRLHDTRGTMNGILEQAGVPDSLRAAWLGHTVVVNRASYLPVPKDLAAVSGVVGALFAPV